MRTFLVLMCSLALVCAAVGAQKEDKSKKAKKKQAQSTQHVAPGTRPAGGGPQKTTGHGASGSYSATGSNVSYQKKTKGSQRATTAAERPGGAEATQKRKGKTKGSQQITTQRGQGGGAYGTRTTAASVKRAGTKTYKSKHFNLETNTRPAKVRGVTFQQNRRIVGSQNWHGANYTVFRTYAPVWHDRIWWGSHYNRVVFVFGGWYYWNAGWWYPAWGYAPNAYYAYDGPIYAYNDLPPDQVIANVQAALQGQGYYADRVDGLLGPRTRAAIADYQRDHGLYETAAIDRPTLESLGIT
jgi:hypothetical protein